MSKDFSAAASTLGYLYQARYALCVLLDSPEEAALAIERFDDISFERDGTPQELLQLKHHSKPSSLTNSSSDLWKTLRIWSTFIKDKTISLPGTILMLVTTSNAPNNSIASSLRPGKQRDISSIIKKLLDIANDSENKTLQASFEAFKSLSYQEKELLVSAIQIIDNSPNISDTSSIIKRRLLTVRRQYLDAVYERLEGWWFSKVVKNLMSDTEDVITRYELQEKIADIADQFKSDNLPIDFLNTVLGDINVTDYDNRIFVLQLKEIALSNKRIEKAILDYYKAFEQRARWARESLLFSDEIEAYERKLVDEWDRFCDKCLDGRQISDDESKSIGRDIFYWMDMEAEINIRSMVKEPYVMRGSFHMLADNQPPKVWWHPQFISRLEALLVNSEE